MSVVGCLLSVVKRSVFLPRVQIKEMANAFGFDAVIFHHLAGMQDIRGNLTAPGGKRHAFYSG